MASSLEKFRLIKRSSTDGSVIQTTIVHGYFVLEISWVKFTPIEEALGFRRSTKLLS
jgi:hypothetical protein